jgi:hypothetical protein
MCVVRNQIMSLKKLRNDAMKLATMSFVCLLLNIAACIYLYGRSKDLETRVPVIPGLQAVPLSVHKSSLEFIRLFETTLLPAFSCGYLLIGLLGIRHYQRLKDIKIDETNS